MLCGSVLTVLVAVEALEEEEVVSLDDFCSGAG